MMFSIKIEDHELNGIRERFSRYVGGFYTGHEELDAAIRLKEDHTQRVVSEILDIAGSSGFNEQQCHIAEIAALLHDIGRFPQYARYQTYVDAITENHALLGTRVILETGILSGLAAHIQELLVRVVEHHNRPEVPRQDDEDFILYLKLVRDADKLDIYRVATDYYSGVETNEVIAIGLPDSPEVSDAVIDSFVARRPVAYHELRSLNDFKVVQLGWVFDINFVRTFELVKQRGYLKAIARTLPPIPQIRQVMKLTHAYVEQKCRRN